MEVFTNDRPVKKVGNRAPNAGCIKPGERRNPHGRPKIGESVAEIFREALKEIDPKAKKEKLLALFDRAYKGAMGFKADAVRWADLVLDRAYGKPSQPITGKDGGPISIELNPEERKARIQELLGKREA